MNTTFTLKASLLAATLAVMPLAHAVTMTQAEYKADKIRISAEKCDALAGDAKASCMSAAKLKYGKS